MGIRARSTKKSTGKATRGSKGNTPKGKERPAASRGKPARSAPEDSGESYSEESDDEDSESEADESEQPKPRSKKSGKAVTGGAPQPPPPPSQAALYAAIRSYNGKVGDLNFTALTDATHAPDVDCNHLTAESNITAIKVACEALGRALKALGARLESQLPADREKKRAQLQACLAYPLPKLKKAFMAHLQEEAALEGGGRRVETAFEAMLAARMQVIVSGLVKPATVPRANSDDYVEMKRLFRAICKNYNDEWVASCGSDTDLDKANAAVLDLDEGQRLEIPNAVKVKWQAALCAVHGEKCKFKNRTCLTGGKEITVWHIYHFSEAGQPHPYHPYDPYDLYDPYHPRPKSPLVPPVPPV